MAEILPAVIGCPSLVKGGVEVAFLSKPILSRIIVAVMFVPFRVPWTITISPTATFEMELVAFRLVILALAASTVKVVVPGPLLSKPGLPKPGRLTMVKVLPLTFETVPIKLFLIIILSELLLLSGRLSDRCISEDEAFGLVGILLGFVSARAGKAIVITPNIANIIAPNLNLFIEIRSIL